MMIMKHEEKKQLLFGTEIYEVFQKWSTKKRSSFSRKQKFV